MTVRVRVERPPALEAAAGAERSGTERRWTDPALATVLLALPVAGLLELVLVRTFYRVGVYIPKDGPFRTVYAALTALGSYALDLASVLAAAALALLGIRAWRAGRTNAALALGAFLLSSVIVRVAGVEQLGPTARLTFGLAVVALAAPFVRGRAHPLRRVLVAVVAACFLLSSYAGLTADGVRLTGASTGGGVAAQLAAEWLVVAAALLALAAWVAGDGPRAGPLLISAPPAGALLTGWWANGAVTGILVLWTVGLRLFLPVWLYALALWGFLAAALGWFRGHRHRSIGLVLLLVSGLLLGSTYAQAVGLVALALLSDGAATGGVPPLGREPPAAARPVR